MSRVQSPYVIAESVSEACDLLAEHGPDAKVVAGGQSLSLLLRQDLLDPSVIVDISELSELDGIRVPDGRVRIGAATTYNALGSHEVAATYGCLGDAVAVIADEQIRNLGTVGGAVAHADPSLDVLPPLLCLDADVVVVGPNGRREIAFEDFYTGYMMTDLADGEIVHGIEFDAATALQGSAYEKHANVTGGWATVGAGARVTLSADGEEIEEVRVALAAVGDTPVRAAAAEDALAGATPTDRTIETAAEAIPDDIDPLEDIAGSPEYKESVAVHLGARALRGAIERAQRGENR